MVYCTCLRQLLASLVRPELIGISVREAENLSTDVDTRVKVGKLMDRVLALGGAELVEDGVSAIAKVGYYWVFMNFDSFVFCSPL